MGKKIALLILGLALVLGVFTVYQYVTGAGGGGPRPKVKITNPPTTLPMYVEERLPDGTLLYVITAAKAPELLRDKKTGEPIPGYFRVEKPLATYFDGSGRIVQISADEFRVVVDQAPKGAGGLPGTGGKGGGGLAVREGELEGHVRMILTAKPGGGTNPLDGGLRIYCDDILHLDAAQETLSTSGPVHMRSDRQGDKAGRVAFDGRGMQLMINRKEKKLTYLGIEKGERLVLRDVPTKALSFLEPATRESATAPGSKPAKETSPALTYRLTLAEDIRATMDKSSLASEHLYMVFTTAKEMLGDTRPASSPASATAPATVPALDTGPAVPPVLMIPEVPEVIAAANPTDLVVTWKGPMELRPADDTDPKLAGAGDIVLDAMGSGGKPVTVSDPRFEAQMGRLWYRGEEQRVLLEPRDFKKVVLSALTGPNRGNVECGTVSVDQKTNHAVLTGPGTMVARSAKEGGMATTLTWKTHMDLDLESAPDAKDATKKTLAIRRAVLDGVTIKNDAFDLKADVLDALIANVADKGKPVQKLEKLRATGNVLVHSYRKGTGSERGGMQTKEMQILTARGESGLPEPSQLTAVGDVIAWQLVDKSKGAGVPAIQKESITTPKLAATLVPKARSATAPADDSGLAGMEDALDVSRFVASAGARVEIVPPAGSKIGTIVATADTIDGKPLEGTALLTAAGANPVRIAIGENMIEGRTIALDNGKRSITVPEKGLFNVTLPPDQARKKAMPMVVTWQGSMTYDDLKHLAVFTGQPVARVLSSPGPEDPSDQASLRCEKTLTVQLKERDAPAAGPALIAGNGLDLDWIQADGNVDARGVQLGEDNKPLTRVRLSAPTLRYSATEKSFVVDGAGALVFEDFRPDKPDAKFSTAGESDFNWLGSLKYDGKNNVITITKSVDYFFRPVKPFKISELGRSTTSAPAGPRQPDILRLHTDQLVATLAASKDGGKVVESPIGLGAGGGQEVSRVEAKGGLQFTVGTYRILNGAMAIEPTWLVSGDTMTFDVPARIGTITGKDPEPAMAQRVGSGSMSGRSVKFDAAKNYLEVSDWQGRVANFGG